jgi:prophage regulatory protein
MRFIRAREVLRMIGVSRTTLWRMVRAGLFPQPVRITKRNTGYIFDDVESWMRDRARGSAPEAVSDGSRPVSRPATSTLLRGGMRAQD